jgi:hypothetical protein
MARTASWLLLAIMVGLLAGCGRTPTAPEGAAKKTPSPVHTRTTLPGAR